MILSSSHKQKTEEDNEVDVMYGAPSDINAWMDLVRRVKWEFPGLETEAGLEEHRDTVLTFMEQRQAICVKTETAVSGVLLFSRSHNMICCLAVLPQYRRTGVASRLLEAALGELDHGKDITVSTFRADDERGIAPRALYKKYGFAEGALTVEFDCPSQRFVLRPQ